MREIDDKDGSCVCVWNPLWILLRSTERLYTHDGLKKWLKRDTWFYIIILLVFVYIGVLVGIPK